MPGGRPKKHGPKRGRIEVTAPMEWVRRVTDEAARLGLNPPSYIRMVVTMHLDKQDAERRREAGE
jgi:hypothetical protein